MKVIALNKSEQNIAAVDPWTVVHFAAGLAAGLIDAPFKWSMAAAIVYDVLEQGFERSEVGQRFFKTNGPESVANVLVDLVAFAGGHMVGSLWNDS